MKLATTDERTKAKENAVRVKQGRRAGTGMVMAKHRQKTVTVKKTAELLQQFNGPLRFGKHSPICVQFIRETSETQEQFFSVFENDRRY